MAESWRNKILERLERRKEVESNPFADVVKSHVRLLETATVLKLKNSELELGTYQLKQEILDLQRKVAVGSSDQLANSDGKQLETKIFRLQEELTELHRARGEISNQVILLTRQLREKDDELSQKESQLTDIQSNCDALAMESKRLHNSMAEMEATNQILKDEFQALQLLNTSIEEKLRKVQDDNSQLIARWLALKQEDADRHNAEVNQEVSLREHKLKLELLEAANKPLESSTSRSASFNWLQSNGTAPLFDLPGPAPPIVHCVTSVPDRARQVFSASYQDAHDGEVTSIRFSGSGRYFVTGGSDRKVKVWELGRGSCSEVATLHGSGQSVMCARFDAQEKLILAASNDHACRVWAISDQRLRHALTGHTEKVLAAKFLGADSSKVVSGSHDRTLKIWDLRSKACTKTIFAGSSCNDVVTSDLAGTTLVSGHFDKKIRFWDIRSDQDVNEIQLQGKVTSLDVSQDMNYLLASTRDDSLKLIDLRRNQIISTYRTEGFKVAFDYTRACFSPDSQYVMCGSQDGGLYVWNTKTNQLEKVLREHKSPVIGVAWHPAGSCLLSCDRSKTIYLWTDL